MRGAGSEDWRLGRKHLERVAATEIQKIKKAQTVSTLFPPSGIKFIAATREENWIEE